MYVCVSCCVMIVLFIKIKNGTINIIWYEFNNNVPPFFLFSFRLLSKIISLIHPPFMCCVHSKVHSSVVLLNCFNYFITVHNMKCSHCGRERNFKKINSTNWNRHINSCKMKHKGGIKSLDSLNYFIKTNKPCASASDKYLIYIFWF